MEESSTMKLNVGGESFQLYYGTLKAASYFRNLNKMVPQRDAISTHQEGSACHFIDRDPEIFQDILHYLKTWEVLHPADKHYLVILQNEADFYGFYDLVKRIDQMLSPTALDDKLFSEAYESKKAEYLPLDFDTIKLDSTTNETLVQAFCYTYWQEHQESKIVVKKSS